MDFETWWNETGSGILPLPGADMEEHGKLVAGEAWDAAIKGFLEAWEHGQAAASAEIERLRHALCADLQPTCSKPIP
jgi:hypothetical protein